MFNLTPYHVKSGRNVSDGTGLRRTITWWTDSFLMSLLSRTTQRSLRCHREHLRSQRRQHTPRRHCDRRCAIPPAHANETRWVSRAPKCTVFKRKRRRCLAAPQSHPVNKLTAHTVVSLDHKRPVLSSSSAQPPPGHPARRPAPRPRRGRSAVRSIQRTGPSRIHLGTTSVGSRVRHRPPLPSAPHCRACKGPVKYLPQVDGGTKQIGDH